jgi:hypothetical protein
VFEKPNRSSFTFTFTCTRTPLDQVDAVADLLSVGDSTVLEGTGQWLGGVAVADPTATNLTLTGLQPATK